MPQSAQELNRIAATRSLPDDPYGQDAGIIGKIIDVFKQGDRSREGSRSLTMDSVRVAIAGAGGRMGRALIEAVLAAPGLALGRRARRRRAARCSGRDAGEHCGRATGVMVDSDIDAAVARADVLVDFTRPEGTLSHLAACARHGVAAVVGTTGLSDAQKAALAEHARAIPIVFAANMSVGVNVLLSLVENRRRARWGPGYDIEIVEMHHRHKVDAPSGTALRLGEAAAAGVGRAVSPTARSTRGTASPASASRARSASRRCAAATSWASTRSCSRAKASASRSSTARRRGKLFAGGALRAIEFVAAKRAQAADRRVRHARRARVCS